MAEIVAEFLGVIGVDKLPPYTLAELIPYQYTIYIGVAMVTGVFRVIGRLVEVLLDVRRW